MEGKEKKGRKTETIQQLLNSGYYFKITLIKMPTRTAAIIVTTPTAPVNIAPCIKHGLPKSLMMLET